MNYSGKKKRHTRKTQIVADESSRKIICTVFDNGRRHDFRLFKESKVYFKATSKCLTYTGYQGFDKIHANSEHPKKRSKRQPLTKEDKKRNREISSRRIMIENIIRDVKIFRILAGKYRNRRKRFALRFNLIAALYNSNIDYK
ncbi:MAG: transposase [Prevotellaceae bacterium]|nr:transposase [Prevotellaceae bacterium]